MAQLISLETFSDTRGHLTVLEKVLPFDIKRVYWMYGVDGPRGGHRHLETYQALVCVHGQCQVQTKLKSKEELFELSSPQDCLLLPPEDWHVLDNWADDAVVMVLASKEYDSQDYVKEPLL